MSATIISFPKAGKGKAAQPAPSCARTEDEKAILTRVLILQIARNMGLPMTAERHGFLHRYGHLAP